MKSKRLLKVEKEIKQILGMFLLTRYQGLLQGMVTLSRVIVSGDLRQAKIYVSMMGESDADQQNLQFLQSRAYEMQKELASALPTKFCPKLYFFKDEALEKSMKIDRLLDSISKNKSS